MSFIKRLESLSQVAAGVPEEAKALFSGRFSDLARTPIAGGRAEISKGHKVELADHLGMVRREFLGRSELEYTHAGLIVLMRRKIATRKSWSRFSSMWTAERDFLLKNLDSRWLLSASDTIADNHPDRAERAVAVCAGLLVTTVRLYETEIWMKGIDNKDVRSPVAGRIVFDGLTYFMVGAGDAVHNLRNRVLSLQPGASPAYFILKEIFDRLCRLDSVYGRFLDLHKVKETRWD